MTLDVERLLPDHWSGVYRYVHRRMQDIDLAVVEDLTADTFLRALRAASSYRERGDGPRSWLLTIALRLVIDWRRRQALLAMVDLRIVDYYRSQVDAGTGDHDMVIDLRDALAALPPEGRAVVWGQAEGWTQWEAGGSFGLSKTASWRRYRSGLAVLRQRIGRRDDDRFV